MLGKAQRLRRGETRLGKRNSPGAACTMCSLLLTTTSAIIKMHPLFLIAEITMIVSKMRLDNLLNTLVKTACASKACYLVLPLLIFL